MSFVSSVYTFTEPVRKFKANDPYYFEVDNIPVGQLEENCLWLKDQIDSIQDPVVSRDTFNELQPYVNGSDNIVRVKPGRFSARINDVSNKAQLQALKNETTILGGNKWTVKTFINTQQYNSILAQLISTTSSLEFNGLEMRRLNFADGAGGLVFTPGSIGFPGPFNFTAPIFAAAAQDVIKIGLSWAATDFVKAFRSPGRTAIVDVASELTIPIEKWDNEDFFYYVDNVKTLINASVRIDLLVILAHPVDTSSTRVYSPDFPHNITTITEPRLAIVKGAGVGVSKSNIGLVNFVALKDGTSVASQTDALDFYPVYPYNILPNVADQNNASLGFKGLNIKGTFPSPDDLLNVSPLLSNNGSKTSLGIASSGVNDFHLAGQSVLPLAYIVVKNSTPVSNGIPVLQTTNLVDIRPFFRTTELSYNERAGIIAAVPQLSLANPVATRKNLDDVAKTLQSLTNVATTVPRPVAGGVIWGGFNFGPEGAIDNVMKTFNPLASLIFSGVNSNVPSNPDWDLAEWWGFENISDTLNPGTKRNDRVNFYFKANGQNLDGGAGNSPILGVHSKNSGSVQEWLVSWVSKKFVINKTLIPWMQDYTVEVTLENCVGMTSKFGGEDDYGEAGSYGTFVEKNADSFVIYVFWVSTRPFDALLPHENRDSTMFTQWVAKHSAFNAHNNESGTKALQAPSDALYPVLGACTYPTVSFKVTGYPTDYFTNKFTQSGTPIIVFK